MRIKVGNFEVTQCLECPSWRPYIAYSNIGYCGSLRKDVPREVNAVRYVIWEECPYINNKEEDK